MLPYSDSKITRVGLIIFFIVIVFYGIFEAQGLLFGPRIYVSTNTAAVHDPYVQIEGSAEHIASLSMNGKSVPVTEKGEFKEPLLLATGDNRIVLEAMDKYGRSTRQIVEIVYVPNPAAAPIPQKSASTTPPK